MSEYVKLKVGEDTYDKLSLNDKIKIESWLTECENIIEAQLEEAAINYMVYGTYSIKVDSNDR